MQSETPLERFRRRCGVTRWFFWKHHRKTPFWRGYWQGRNVGYKNGYSVGRRGGYKSGYAAGRSSGYRSGYTNGSAAQKRILSRKISSSYSRGYSIGKSHGYKRGYKYGRSAGYRTGNAAGYKRGYSVGYGNGRCRYFRVLKTWLSGYPKSTGRRRYSRLSDAQNQCNKLKDCGGVTYYHSRYELRRGTTLKLSTLKPWQSFTYVKRCN